MRVYLEGGAVGSSMRINPQKVQLCTSQWDREIPPEIRTHYFKIVGEDGETITLQGDIAELKELARLMAEALEGAKE